RLAPDLEAPGLVHRPAVTELRKRDPHFGRPAQRIDMGTGFPYRIPRQVHVGSTRPVAVGADARRVDLEQRAAQVIVVGAEDDLDVIGISLRLPPERPAPD